jgi:hypothetical protein
MKIVFYLVFGAVFICLGGALFGRWPGIFCKDFEIALPAVIAFGGVLAVISGADLARKRYLPTRKHQKQV